MQYKEKTKMFAYMSTCVHVHVYMHIIYVR